LRGLWFALSARGTWEEKKITDADYLCAARKKCSYSASARVLARDNLAMSASLGAWMLILDENPQKKYLT